MNIGKKIELARRELNLNQTQLGQAIGRSRNTVWRWEAGEIIPKTRDIQKISELTQKDISYFLEESESSICEPQESYGKLEHTDFPNSEPCYKIPVLSWTNANKVSISEDYYPLDTAEKWIISATEGKNMFALEIIDDQMEPEFREGEFISVLPKSKPQNGDYVLVKDAKSDRAIFKQLKIYGTQKVLHPTNPKYKDIILNGDARYSIIGKIVAKTKQY